MARPSLSSQTTTRILSHICERGLPEGHHLPAQGLADALRVSRAPVSAALKQMAADGIVRLEPNRGYFLARDAADLAEVSQAAPPAVEPEDAFYAALVEGCLSGELPDKVSESELMRLYDVPRTRVVKTLNRVQNEGWAARRPGNGWEFLPRLMSRESYEEAYQFRAAIESQSLLLPTFRIDAAAFAKARAEQEEILAGGFERMSRAHLFELNSHFHEMLVGCGHNAFFVDALARVNRLRRLLEYRITTDRSRLPLQSKEHLLILDIVEAGDRPRASEFLRAHILGASAIKSPSVGA
ncbi:GntR family transcriptional regulator [Aureimonas phyllosphaerae]|uniref:DNA-binding GntR family transcriptional regulator n=1 Tax=Aureimonas phyllosphaerae TaxID=1166078 RepID=A0A7W6C254_9HYPH|nr:GntR family transcriptional regulator [Aureimonas phyllosphaerae]MBB3938126.1 DNA-binding GntR family transcriptional regulator [Aureimonas phyllosphaerae]MBB3962141.1 DNA-binding GntR family transcriptional regulator [Aureimonas phyllosphaerae]SFF56246.1 DNA-binding transcriptional regulator, GntR family [Aureimonas phyllosphaerae]